MPIDYPALGKRIAFFRNQSHLTQEDFAYEVHLSRQYISQLETAACRPSLETIVEIANTLGVSTDDLLVDSPPSYRYPGQEWCRTALPPDGKPR